MLRVARPARLRRQIRETGGLRNRPDPVSGHGPALAP